eukprot:2414606-Amphidinium_carterae.1
MSTNKPQGIVHVTCQICCTLDWNLSKVQKKANRPQFTYSTCDLPVLFFTWGWTCLISTYIPPAGHDLLDPNMYFKALADIELQLDGHSHRLILGDWNAWLGCSLGMHVGQYNLAKTNYRGQELSQWIAIQ